MRRERWSHPRLSRPRRRVPVAGLLAAWALATTVRSSEPPPAARLVLDFEDASAWTSENQSPFEVSTDHATQGGHSLKVHYTNKPEWSNIYTRRLPGDWSGMNFLNVDVFLDGDQPAACGLWVRDAAQHKAESGFTLAPGANTITVDLDELKRRFEFDRSHVIAICLFKNCPAEITVYWDNLTVTQAAPARPKAVPVVMSASNLLSNASFEELQPPDALGNPFRWWLARRWQGRSFLGRGTNAVFAGASSAMLEGRGVCKIGFCSPPVKVQSPTRLRLTAHVQVDGVQKGLWNQTGGLAVTDAGERGLPGADVALPAGTSAWRRVDIVFDVPEKCPAVKVFFQLCGPGRAWIDDVSLGGVPLDTPLGAAWTDTGRPLRSDPPFVTETPVLQAQRVAAEKALADLRRAAADARAAGIETLYDEIPLVLGNLAFDVRWDLPDHLALRGTNAAYVLARATEALRHLQDVRAGRAPDLKVPPHPDFAKLELRGRYFFEGQEPRLLLSMQYHNSGELLRWFAPRVWTYGVSAVGAERYNVQGTPVWEAYRKYPETHRVHDGGWCGHIVCDPYSAGGSSQPCVISLDSPRMREAIAASIGRDITRRPPRPGNLINNVGFEYSYENYDAFTAALFRQWLGRKYDGIAALNAAWKTSLRDFAAVDLPPYLPGQTEPNPAKYYDFGEFNLWRFTDYMRWAREEMRQGGARLPVTTGGGDPFGAGFWRQGIDEEGLLREGVDDVCLSETGSRALGVTSTMDLQRSLAERPTLILDPEYHALPNTCLLMFLHGCGVMDYWWWPESEGDFDESALRHSPTRSLEEVGVVMRAALDVRRLAKRIAPFPEAPAEVALLYSRASLVQRDPRAQGNKTPYTLEVERSYQAAVRLDAPVGFVSSRRVREGIPAATRLLIVPGCRYVEADVFTNLLAWARNGGMLVITPTSLVADEYSRKRNYLAQLGIEVTSEELPELTAGDARRGIDQTGEMDFIQGPVAKTIVSREPRRTLDVAPQGLLAAVGATLDAAGTIQTLRASPDWTAAAKYGGDGGPAIVARPLGKGRVVYLGAQLSVGSRRAVLDRLMDLAGVSRPVRVHAPDGGCLEDVESRTVAQDGALLTYLCNTAGRPAEVELVARTPVTEIWNFQREERVPGPNMVLAPFETRIMRVRLQP